LVRRLESNWKTDCMLASRRHFIRSAALTGASFLASQPLLFASENKTSRLTVLHTNDVHSRLDPFTDGNYKGKGGVSARAKLIREIRGSEENVLLLDAGDMFQGTPYFNLYKGEPEIRAMSMMGYDAGTIGNHDYDAGIENLANQLSSHAKFPIVICNYDFRGTPMEHKYQPYKVIKKGDLTIGITGVGIEMKGLVADGLYGTTQYLDPVKLATDTASYLKDRKKCDMVICLSHLGDKYDDDKVSDEILARRSRNIDLIIGAHTHRFFEKPRIYDNEAGEKVIVNQVGWGGIQLGRLDYEFSRGKKNVRENSQLVVAEKKQ
jgi:5'-nucleotidase